MKKFYIGAIHIGQAVAAGGDANCMRSTLAEAIAEAKTKIRNGDADCLVIVEVVRVVRRDTPPIVVEEV